MLNTMNTGISPSPGSWSHTDVRQAAEMDGIPCVRLEALGTRSGHAIHHIAASVSKSFAFTNTIIKLAWVLSL
jgi:hypothetical protein